MEVERVRESGGQVELVLREAYVESPRGRIASGSSPVRNRKACREVVSRSIPRRERLRLLESEAAAD